MLSDREQANIRELYRALLAMETEDEMAAFLDDICTIKEVLDMSTRLEVAKLLDEGQVFNQIIEETGSSSATISRVNKCLNFGPGGYRLAIDRTKKE